MFTGKKILITGGTGSWGNELATQLLEKDPKEVKILSLSMKISQKTSIELSK